MHSFWDWKTKPFQNILFAFFAAGSCVVNFNYRKIFFPKAWNSKIRYCLGYTCAFWDFRNQGGVVVGRVATKCSTSYQSYLHIPSTAKTQAAFLFLLSWAVKNALKNDQHKSELSILALKCIYLGQNRLNTKQLQSSVDSRV